MEKIKGMTAAKSPVFIGILCTLVGGIFWGFSAACGQYLFDNYNVDSSWLTAVRMLASGIILIVYSVLVRGKGKRREVFSVFKQKKDLFAMLNFAITGLLLCQFSYLTAIQYSNAGTATVLQYVGLVLVMVWVCFRERRAPEKRELLAVGLALAGTFLLTTHGNPGELVISREGLIWGLIAAIGLASYTLVPTWILEKHGAPVVTGWAMLAGGTVMAAAGRIWTVPVHLGLDGFAALAGVVLVGTVFAYTLFLMGIQKIGALKASVIGCVEPVSAAIFAVLWLGSKFEPIDLIAFVCIISTVFLLVKKEDQETEEAAEAIGQTA